MDLLRGEYRFPDKTRLAELQRQVEKEIVDQNMLVEVQTKEYYKRLFEINDDKIAK